ncbi:O-antigen ligase family protein [Listeria booriae]|uniref:O-antigen ligase family protein n=1 Tax=Listeria booriae TaxID=1552123 RepID=UPI0021AB9373|nr:O-antigen ligase family protein [Listeria booriae]
MPIINWLQTHFKPMLFIIGITAVLQACVFLPYGFLALPLFLVAVFIFLPINMEKFTTALSFVIIFSGFFGSYLGIPGNENIFLFRLLIPIHLFLFVFFVKKDWLRLRYVKVFLFLFIAFFIGMMATGFWAPELGQSFRYLYFIFEWLYVIFLCVYYIRTEKIYDSFAKWLTVLYIGILMLGVWECLTGQHLSQSGSLFYETTTSAFQPTGFQFNTNDFASLITIFFPIVMLYITTWKRKLIMLSGLLGVGSLSLYLVIMTNSRLAMVVLVLEMLVLLFGWSKIWSFVAVYVLGMGALLVSTFHASGFVQKLLGMVNNSFTDKGDSTSERIQMYQASWNMIKESHFMGIGAGNLPIRLDEYMYGFERASDNYWAPHNYWLEALANGGLLAFIPLLAFFITYVVFAIRYWVTEKYNAFSAIPLLIGIAFVAASIGLSSTIDKRHLSLGIGMGLAALNIYYLQKGRIKND